jgi:hypothetical protein
MDLECIINDIREAKEFRTTTLCGYKKSEVKKELIKSIKESEIEPACYWSAELVCSGFYSDLWDVIICVFTMHIHVGNPALTIYLEKRVVNFKEIVTNGYTGNELAMRNNSKIRQIFCEIVCILSLTNKKHRLEEIKVSPEYFDMTNIKTKLRAPDISYGEIVFKEGDPKELYMAVNELSFNISKEGKNTLLACFWIEWIMEYRKIRTQKKQKCVCEKRLFAPVDEKCQNEVEWIIWDLFLKIANKHTDKRLHSIVRSLCSLYSLKYSAGSYKKRKFVMYFVVSMLVDNPTFSNEFATNETKRSIKNVCSGINNVYKQIKEKEQTSETGYSLSDLSGKGNIDKTQEKLDRIAQMNETFIPRI